MAKRGRKPDWRARAAKEQPPFDPTKPFTPLGTAAAMVGTSPMQWAFAVKKPDCILPPIYKLAGKSVVMTKDMIALMDGLLGEEAAQ